MCSLLSVDHSSILNDLQSLIKARRLDDCMLSYKYDSSNHLTTVVSGTLVATYEYNDQGLRTSMTVNSVKTNFLWDINASLPVIISDTNSIHIYGLSLIARQTGSDVEYYHTDALGPSNGRMRNLTNGSGQNVGNYSYRPFAGT